MKHGECGKWLQASALHTISDQEILESISLHSKTYRAISIEEKERFLLIEIDAESLDANPMIWISLKMALRRLGHLEPRLYRAAATNTYQAFLFFSETIPVRIFAQRLQTFLSLFDISAKDAVVHEPGDRFAIPLLSGFAWLNDQFTPVVRRDEVALDAALCLFVNDATKGCIIPEVFLETLDSLLVDVAPAPDSESVRDAVTEPTSMDIVAAEIEAPAFEILLDDLLEDGAVVEVDEGLYAESQDPVLEVGIRDDEQIVQTPEVCLDISPILDTPDEPGILEFGVDGQFAGGAETLSEQNLFESDEQEQSEIAAPTIDLGGSECPVEPVDIGSLLSIQIPETSADTTVTEIDDCPGEEACPGMNMALTIFSGREITDLKTPTDQDSRSEGTLLDPGNQHCNETDDCQKLPVTQKSIQLALPFAVGLSDLPAKSTNKARVRGKPKRDPPDG